MRLPRELAREAGARRGGAAYVRQLCWRDFHHQVLAADPSLPRRDYRPRGPRSRSSERWRPGRRAAPGTRSSTPGCASCRGGVHAQPGPHGSRLVPDQGPLVDWRRGAGTSWVCSPTARSPTTPATGSGSPGPERHPAHRVLNPVRQAQRFDPDGTYVRRYVPELEPVRGKDILRPWRMEGFSRLGYPAPIVDHDEAVAEFQARRG